jgi:hypothetical protein
MIRPGMLARLAEELADPAGSRRATVMAGYHTVRDRMQVNEPPSSKAAAIVADILEGHSRA